MLLSELRSFVRENTPSHLAGLWNSDMETQLVWPEQRIRVPHDGNGQPSYDDTAYYPSLDTVSGVGVTGWDWRAGKTLFVTIDIDGLNHSAGHAGTIIDDLIQRFKLVDQVEIIRSKSGHGIHIRVYFDPEHAPPAKTRKDHIANGEQVVSWLSARMTIDLDAKRDCVGVVAWIWHRERQEGGFELIKRSTAYMPDDWHSESPRREQSEPTHEQFAVMPKHDALIDWLVSRNMGEFADGRLTTHTFHLALAAQDKSLKIAGSFATLASGKEGTSGRNCYMFPDADGSWRVFRYHKGTKEHESWWTSQNHWTTCWFNRAKQKLDPTATLVSLAKSDELFHDSVGRTFTTTAIRDVRETVQLSDAQYRAKLRLAYTEKTGCIASGDAISTAIDQISAIALLESPEYPIAIRVAEHNGELFIDLANRQRQIVKLTASGWEVVDAAPVRFVRPFGLLPLPNPLPGGKLSDLREFVNIEDDDLPLLLAFVVGCFHPAGPYALLQLTGEQGSAKSSLMRLLHELIDPNLAVGNTLPKDDRDFLVAAQLRWLLSYDNVDALNRKFSSMLCMIVTGAASANRKLFSDSDQAILRAKRPVILTSIHEVVTASDLLDRTLTLILPTIDPANRMSEFAISQALRRDGVRGRIFGFILDGVVAALAGHADVKRDDMPRLADLFSWATAAERGFCLDDGAVLAAYKRQREHETNQTIAESPFAQRIIKICMGDKGFRGTPQELSERLNQRQTAREVGCNLREIAPDLRRAGYVVEFGRSNGKRFITLEKAA